MQEFAALVENDAWSHCWDDEDEDDNVWYRFRPVLKVDPELLESKNTNFIFQDLA